MPRPPTDARRLLEALFRAGVAAVDPGPALRRALRSAPSPDTAPAVLAFGKAAPAMMQAYLTWLATHGLAPQAGLLVAPVPMSPPHPAIRTMVGDHPVPGAGSRAAADVLGRLVATLPREAPVDVLLSGGTSALLGAPREGIDEGTFAAMARSVLGDGADIVAANTRRRAVARWAEGRLAEALGDRPVRCWVLSDVPGDHLATIGSGPLVPRGDAPPTVPHVIIGSGRDALDGVTSAARDLGLQVECHGPPLMGEADRAGAAVVHVAETSPGDRRILHAWAGETTVTLPEAAGTGGRCQQLALAAAAALATTAVPITVLAAGTDGRDGPTDAAGAVVDGATWGRMVAAGCDPARALAARDAYSALDAVGALLRTGPTGTNVADLVLVLVEPG